MYRKLIADLPNGRVIWEHVILCKLTFSQQLKI